MSRWRSRVVRGASGDDGAATVEYLGVVLVVIAIISSIIVGATPVGQVIAARLCEAFGTTCGAESGPVDADGDRIPEDACTVSTDTEQINGKVSIAFIDLGTEGTMVVEKMSDGTYRVTVSGEGGIDAVLSAGEAKGGLQIGDYGGSLELSASVSAGLFAGVGLQYDFDSKDDVDKFVNHVHRELVKSGAKGVLGSSNPAIGIGVDVGGWLIDKVTGYDYKPPSSPNSTYYEGGVSGNASASAGGILAGGSGSVDISNAMGFEVDHKTNDVTVYNRVTLDAEAAVQLGLSSSDGNWGQGAGGSAGIEMVVSTTVDKSGKVTGVSFDGAATAEGAMALTQLAGFPLDGSGGKGVQMSASFDVTDANRSKVLAALGGLGVMSAATGGAVTPQVAIPAILAEARRSGDITAQLLDVSNQNLVDAALSLKAPAIGGLGFELGASTSSSDSTDAFYLGRSGWKDWAACAA
ncbi:hypothetical protein H9657_08930 [Cellulomonas sp. Sa3CUA2]|uniref:Uncharacterized protein n=1 Tax=Cellulomonas avistercoris TaxID=2762242 RepID=A0ABR8QDK6_9CELL|nr:hypothetical protein [Cellulomonas avistercoris]MBD7918399.1 hypothetical protein [Cellulomonas avistercoris]